MRVERVRESGDRVRMERVHESGLSESGDRVRVGVHESGLVSMTYEF